MDSLKLISAYCYPPNSKKYCGPDCSEKILAFLQGKSDDKQFVKNAFSKFETMFPYLELIAEANGKEPFDLEVAQAYWQGNELLENVGLKEWKKTAEKIGKNSEWPLETAKKYSEKISSDFLPQHSFHVLNSFSNTVKEPIVLLERVNNCIISYGKVLQAGEESLTVVKRPVVLNFGKLAFGELQVEHVKNPEIVKCDNGDFVSMHWGFACKKLEKPELENLERYTLKNLQAFRLF